jgi:hypothetical protein
MSLSISKPIGGKMAYIFTTPQVLENPGGVYHPLFSQIQIPVGITVLKVDGEYYEVRYPSSEEYDAADIAYLGGGKYEVSAEEKADLEAAGYDVETV